MKFYLRQIVFTSWTEDMLTLNACIGFIRQTHSLSFAQKNNFQFDRIYSHPVDKTAGIRCNQTIRLKNYVVSKDYPQQLRRIKFYDAARNKHLIFLTNNFKMKSTDIAQLYKHRWLIEIFFKWIKQHLKIKSFWGNSPNAVKPQIRIAIRSEERRVGKE